MKKSMRKALYLPAMLRKTMQAGESAHPNNRGFMMIEAVFSIFIVGTILITFMAVMASVYRTEFAKRDLIVASNLAQEGIEIVRNIRDNNWKATPAKAAFASPPFPGDANGYCVVYNGDYHVNSPTTVCSGNLLNNNGFYEHGSGTATKFSRKVNIGSNPDGSKLITSTVTWDSKTITMTDSLYAWGDAN